MVDHPDARRQIRTLRHIVFGLLLLCAVGAAALTYQLGYQNGRDSLPQEGGQGGIAAAAVPSAPQLEKPPDGGTRRVGDGGAARSVTPRVADAVTPTITDPIVGKWRI